MSKDWIGNSKAVYSILGASNHSKEDREQNDYYATSPIAVEKLLEREAFSKDILEPCCGGGHISEVLKAHGYDVESSDLIDRGYGTVRNIFDITENHKDCITNPPYSLALECVEHLLDISSTNVRIAMLLKIQFLESKKRRKLFEKYPPRTCVRV